jgi:hypothetical protein
MFELGLFPTKATKVPSEKAFTKACDKLPFEILKTLLLNTHKEEFSDNGQAFKGLKIIIPDGTKISLPRSNETLEKYGEAYGHYPQCLAVGFYEPSTGTFEDFIISHMNTPERTVAFEHMKSNNQKSLYLADAGYNGMAFIALTRQAGHEILMPLKMSSLSKKMKKSKKRSAVYEIKLTRSHLMNYPEYKNLVGQIINVRLIRTLGTTKLESIVLITTLLDVKKYPWKKLSALYCHRYRVEVAYRHLKVNLRLEFINKRKLSRIEKFLFATVVLYNLAAMLRNRLKVPGIGLKKHGSKLYCFSFCLNRVTLFCSAIIRPKRGIKKQITSCLQALKSCWFIYKPWRAEPRICNTPPSKFTVHKGKEKEREKENAHFLTKEFQILGVKYDQITA